MKVGDLVHIKIMNKSGIIISIEPPTIRLALELIKVQFFDSAGTDRTDIFPARLLEVISENN